MSEDTTEPKGFCGLCGNPAYKCTCNTTSAPKPQDSMIKLKFTDNGVGPCSDCGNHVNINSEGPATGTKVLCPQCQGNYLRKDKIKEFVESMIKILDKLESNLPRSNRILIFKIAINIFGKETIQNLFEIHDSWKKELGLE